jgi:acetyl esterase
MFMAPLEAALRKYSERALAAPPAWELTLAELRAGPESEAAELWGGAADEVAEVRDVSIDGDEGALRVRVYRPEGVGKLPGLVWLHGGGWVVGSIESHDHLCRAIAKRTPCCVVSVDYRLAPENPFPAAVSDAWAGLLWTLGAADELRIDRTRIAVGGDSAGGNLAAVTALHARSDGIALALQVLAYPVTDADFESESYRAYENGLNLTREKMQWYWSVYLAGADPLHPDASPMRASDLRGVAPALVQTSEYDPLCSEGERYGQRLAEAGVAGTVTRYDGTIHGFLRMPAFTPAANRALDEIAAALSIAGTTAAPPTR